MPGIVNQPSAKGETATLAYAYPGRPQALIKHSAFGEARRGLILFCDPDDDFTDVYIGKRPDASDTLPQEPALHVGQEVNFVVEGHVRRLTDGDEFSVDMRDIDPYEGPVIAVLPPSIYVLSHVAMMMARN